MSEPDCPADRTPDRRGREAARLDRAERLRELLRSNPQAFHDTAEHCELNPAQLKLIVDGGDPSATVILAICDHYNVSVDYVLHGFEGYNDEALGLALDVVMGSVFAATVPAGQRLRLNPLSDHGLIGQARSQYSEAIARHAAALALRHYETFSLSIRAAQINDVPKPDIGDREYPDPWASRGNDPLTADNVSRLPSGRHKTKLDRPL